MSLQQVTDCFDRKDTMDFAFEPGHFVHRTAMRSRFSTIPPLKDQKTRLLMVIATTRLSTEINRLPFVMAILSFKLRVMMEAIGDWPFTA
jgi:hypothetical protein